MSKKSKKSEKAAAVDSDAYTEVTSTGWPSHSWVVQYEPVANAFDPVERPSHYAEGRKYEPIDVIEDWGLDFHTGNALKYISRAGRKGDLVEDVRKAIWYLKRSIGDK
jgi:hypothetical protein